MNIPLLNRLLDERFFEHRRRSTSTAGIVTAEAALLLFAYRYYFDHVVSWDLFAIVATFLVVKLTLMAWYYLTD
jgi:E3 ubiquitin-protein ligase DOA10